MQVGFVGLGTMGARMASNLQKAGYKLIVNDLRKDAAASRIAAGAVWADTPRAIAERSDVILTSLPEPSDVEKVALAADGLLAGVKRGAAIGAPTSPTPLTNPPIASASRISPTS